MEKTSFAQKAQQVIALNVEIEKLRKIFDTPNEQITDPIRITMLFPAVVVAEISNTTMLKAWINDYMPTLIAKRETLETEINQQDALINS